MKNLQKPKTPPLDDLGANKGNVSVKRSWLDEAVMLANAILDSQKNLSTKRKFRTWSSYLDDRPDLVAGQVNIEVSLTVPDDTLTPKQIIERSMRGVLPSIGRVPVYRGEELYPDFEKLDISERAAIIRDIRRDIKKRDQERDDKIREDAEKQRDKEINDRVAAKLAEKNTDAANSLKSVTVS